MQTINLPRNSKILSLQVHYNKPTLWVLEDPGINTAGRKVLLEVTGSRFPESDLEGMEYVGTCLLDGGQFVCHVWIEEEKPNA